MIYENQEQLNAGLAKWQQILRLRDWDISADLLPPRNAPNECGQTTLSWKYKEAHIKINSRVEDHSDGLGEHDHELSLVHELCHLHVRPLERDNPTQLEDMVMEQVVEVLAKSFVNLDRRAT